MTTQQLAFNQANAWRTAHQALQLGIEQSMRELAKQLAVKHGSPYLP